MKQHGVRVGGQALADGVFMRTERAWAIARADGTIETGAVPRNPAAAVPVLRVLVSLAVALRLGIGKGLAGPRGRGSGRRTASGNRRFLYVVLVSEVVVGGIAWLFDRMHVGGAAGYAFHALPMFGALVAMRFVAPSTVWRYHGAEHKAVAAHEAGIDLEDTASVLACPRVHPRCGTNLVVLVALLGVVLQRQPMAVQVGGFLLGVAVAAEILTLAGRWPRSVPSRVLLAGGQMLQAYVTTKEPSEDEQRIACRSLRAALVAHEQLLAAQVGGESVALGAAGDGVPDLGLAHR